MYVSRLFPWMVLSGLGGLGATVIDAIDALDSAMIMGLDDVV